ncbi:MAG: 30S ribosomal protein S6 [Actinobacteria bacterium]|nr:30S ribosomal protein S6 [Actinomycetota bacterium]
MAAPREYELVLMLDPQQDAPARDALAQQARGQIEAAGALKQENNWGLRKMAYEINRRTEADYRWFRFEGTNDLLESLDHELKIADGVLRFRIFKVDANTPTLVPPAVAAPGPRERSDGPRDRGDRGPREDYSRDEAPVESAPEPAAAEPAGE